MDKKVIKTDDEWRQLLTPEQFSVARKKGTEPAFTGIYYDLKDDGFYKCVCCGEKLFSSQTKFDSGSGWPSFWAPESDQSVDQQVDDSYGMHRVEVRCHSCDAHLGHVFEDGPLPTKQRFCINSAALKFEKAE